MTATPQDTKSSSSPIRARLSRNFRIIALAISVLNFTAGQTPASSPGAGNVLPGSWNKVALLEEGTTIRVRTVAGKTLEGKFIRLDDRFVLLDKGSLTPIARETILNIVELRSVRKKGGRWIGLAAGAAAGAALGSRGHDRDGLWRDPFGKEEVAVGGLIGGAAGWLLGRYFERKSVSERIIYQSASGGHRGPENGGMP